MNMPRISSVLAAALLALSGAVVAAGNPGQVTGEADAPVATPHQHGGASVIPNPLDPGAWSDAAGHVQPGITMPFNAMDARSWAMWVDPKSHSKMHMAFTNPAQYAQFMQPQFYMQFMNPNAWMSWMNPASYAVFMDPATWMYWMQPGAYMHGMNPASYMQMMNPAAYTAFMNPATYMSWMDPAAYTIPAPGGEAQAMVNPLDPNAWAKMFDPNTYLQGLAQATKPDAGKPAAQ